MLVIQFWGKWHQRERELKEIEKATNGCLSHSVVNLKDKRVKTKWKTKKKKNKTYKDEERCSMKMRKRRTAVLRQGQ